MDHTVKIESSPTTLRLLKPAKIDVNRLFVGLYLFFLPFTNVFVFNIGFPLKISEILLFVLIFTKLILPKKEIKIGRSELLFSLPLVIYLFIASVSTFTNLFWQYDYPVNHFHDVRFGYQFDSFLKLFYLFLAVISFIIVRRQVGKDRSYYVRAFLAGGIVASLFCWYLLLCSLLHLNPVFFNSSADIPQTFFIPFVGDFYRSGTFKEGNHMGLFLLVCIFVSHQMRSKLAIFFALTIITTFSTPAFLGCFVYFLACSVVKWVKKRDFLKLILSLCVSASLVILLFSNELIRTFTIDKIADTEESSSAYSKFDRLDLIETGFKIGLNNPFVGVGPSHFSLHYNHFTQDASRITEAKRIVNNVYMEIFSETGLVALLSILVFFVLTFRHNRQAKVRVGFLVFLLYLNVYPSFGLLFLWFYLAWLTDGAHIRNPELRPVA